MRQIIVEPALGNQLSALPGQTVVCDKSGRALGFFSPIPHHPPIEELQLEPPSSIAETEERRKDPSGDELSELLASLGLE